MKFINLIILLVFMGCGKEVNTVKPREVPTTPPPSFEVLCDQKYETRIEKLVTDPIPTGVETAVAKITVYQCVNEGNTGKMQPIKDIRSHLGNLRLRGGKCAHKKELIVSEEPNYYVISFTPSNTDSCGVITEWEVSFLGTTWLSKIKEIEVSVQPQTDSEEG